MRKDVKFGLTIGGLLVVVLVIWVLVVNRGEKKKGDVALDQAPADVTPPPADPAPPNPNSQNTPPVVVQAGGAAGATAARADAGSSDPIRTVTGGGDWVRATATPTDWTHLLQSGGGNSRSRVRRGASDARQAPAAGASDFGRPDPLPDQAASPATRPASSERTHVVARGETFTTIAAAEYGSGKYWKRLADANPRVNPSRLKIGTVLNVPNAGESAAPTPGGGESAAASPSPARRGGHRHGRPRQEQVLPHPAGGHPHADRPQALRQRPGVGTYLRRQQGRHRPQPRPPESRHDPPPPRRPDRGDGELNRRHQLVQDYGTGVFARADFFAGQSGSPRQTGRFLGGGSIWN